MNLTFDPDNTLAGGLTSMSPREVIELGIDICAAVESAFGGEQCHGNIWPGKISLIDGRVFLGPAEHKGVKEMQPDALEYISPEQFWHGQSSPASDVYSIGLILYTALNGGVMPFSGVGEQTPETRAAALQARMRGNTMPYPRTAGRELGDVVLRAASFRREDRYADPAALRAALQALPEGAAVPAAVPVMPLSDEEVKSAHSYRVDKEFEKVEEPRPKKAKKPKKENPAREQKEVETFRDPKPTVNNWFIPVVVVAVVVVCLVLFFRSCDMGEETIQITPGFSIINEPDPSSAPAPQYTPDAGPVETPEPEHSPEPEPSPTPAAEPTYQVILEDLTWEEASNKCVELGGHLATVKNDAQLEEIKALAEQSGARYFWLGGYRGANDEWYYVTGEKMTYAVWDTDEPSAYDTDGTEENYLLMWHSITRDIWCFNDARNDPISVLPASYSGNIAFVCQFD